jgi:hypothetical protein
MQPVTVRIEKPDDSNFILGQMPASTAAPSPPR